MALYMLARCLFFLFPGCTHFNEILNPETFIFFFSLLRSGRSIKRELIRSHWNIFWKKKTSRGTKSRSTSKGTRDDHYTNARCCQLRVGDPTESKWTATAGINGGTRSWVVARSQNLRGMEGGRSRGTYTTGTHRSIKQLQLWVPCPPAGPPHYMYTTTCSASKDGTPLRSSL